MSTPPPIFYDPHNRRGRYFFRGMQTLLIVVGGLFVLLTITILMNPSLPGLVLPRVRQVRGLRGVTRTAQAPPVRPSRAAAPPPAKTIVSGETTPPPVAIGFFVNWDDTSFTSLKQNIERLDVLVPEWLHLTDASGTMRTDDQAKQDQVVGFVRKRRAQLKIVPLVNNFDSDTMTWRSEMLGAMLAAPAARHAAIENLLHYVQVNGFAGISIDFETVPTASQRDLETFMTELYGTFHPLGLEVSQSVPLDDPEFNYRALARAADYLILMAYDEHWSESAAGPVASRNWYAAALAKRFAELAPDRYVVALGNYGYDWKDKTRSGTEISFQEAVKTAQESEGDIKLDPTTLNPTFAYGDETNTVHHVWFLDATTTFNEIAEGNRYRPLGYALWRLGSEDPSVWSVFRHGFPADETTARALAVMRYGYDLDYEGDGEVLKVTSTPANGTRLITFDATRNLITDERLTAFPSPYVISRWGATEKKKIALTFDDGPDPTYTPRILDVLKREHAPATFFIIGENATESPDLLKRIVADGHEIGNHTFTHPNVSTISDEQLGVELNATQRLVESYVGRGTLLFRPPYAEDVEPEDPDQVKPVLFAGSLGYYTIGMGIDPNDWRNPGVDRIVEQVIGQVEAGQGNIVLLHDGGGNREETVAALPRIIEALRARGYEPVTVSGLLGLPHDAVMPPVTRSEKMDVAVDQAGFQVVHWLVAGMKGLFLVGIALGIFRLVAVSVLAIGQRLRSRPPKDGFTPRVSVVVPAFNEEKVICRTIDSLLRSTYRNFDILMVDDGSRDGTYDLVRETYRDEPRVRAFSKENGGKSAALNFGLARTDAEIVVALDADTIFHPDAVAKLARHFSDDRVVAVAGNAKVGNRINLMTRWQALEYITSQNLDRRAFDALNCIPVVPGAIGAWRREAIVAAGGFTHETLAEDADLTLTLLRQGHRITYEPEAIALTEAPDTVGDFLKQRFRWMFGTLQAVWKHKDTLLRPHYGALGFVTVPNVLIFQVLFPLVSPLMDLMMAVNLGTALWQKHQHPAEFSTDALWRMLWYYLLFLVIDGTAAAVAFALERREQWSLIFWLPAQRFFYRQLMYAVAIKATMTAIRGSLVGWGKLDRKATVQADRVKTV